MVLQTFAFQVGHPTVEDERCKWEDRERRLVRQLDQLEVRLARVENIREATRRSEDSAGHTPGQTLSPPLLVTAANPLARKSSAATAATTTTAVSTTAVLLQPVLPIQQVQPVQPMLPVLQLSN